MKQASASQPGQAPGREEADLIARGEHPDPFGWLGMHPSGQELVVRAFLPAAEQVTVIDPLGETSFPMERIHEAGVWEVWLRRAPFRYRLGVKWDTGLSQDIEDPYRFPPVLGDIDLHLLGEGKHVRLFEKLGAHLHVFDGVQGVGFAVWAPNARRVSVIGTFNNWDGRRHPMRKHPGVGVWDIFLPGLSEGDLYQYEIKGADGDLLARKSDPFGFSAELPPRTASIVHDIRPRGWGDGAWMTRREALQRRDAPISIYEVHLGSWRRVPEEGNRPLTYLEQADELCAYVAEMGFTHVEFLPVHEFPFSGSWGYQPIGLFAPTSRFGNPEQFRILVERLHQKGIGVLIDWVAGHFPSDPHGLAKFDGSHLYEHADPRQGVHKDWNTLIYNYGRNEVVNFLCSNALFWLEQYHIDGLRVDAVASMLYLDYSREPDEWIPNRHGGRENLEAIEFLRRMNSLVYAESPGAMTVAEESTAWPMVSRPVDVGGLGFGYKWNMGWMHDTLRYMATDPLYRSWHHHSLTFGLLYAFAENFVLPLSHDEVVHGKGSILGRMPGDRWQRFANLRAYYGFMWAHPGKKLLFMGCEIGQEREWDHNGSVDWHLLNDPFHAGVRCLVRDLNRLYRDEPALHQLDCEPDGFQWIEPDDADRSVYAFIRRGRDPTDLLIVLCNFTPVVREDYRIGVPFPGRYVERLNTDSEFYQGSNVHNGSGVHADEISSQGRPWSLSVRLPPLATVILQRCDS